MSGGDAPKMPSPMEQAQANFWQAQNVGNLNIDQGKRTADLNQGYINQQSLANRPTQVTPWGTTSWTKDGKNWTQNTTLTPALQETLNNTFDINKSLSETGKGQLDYIKNAYATDPSVMADQSGATRNKVEDALYGRMTSRLDPQYNQAEKTMDARLAAQGLNPNTEAWNRAKDQFGRQKTDAYQTAMNEAIATGGTEYDRQMKNLITLRELPLQELQAMLAGVTPSMPQMPGFSTQGVPQIGQPTASVPDMSSLMQNSYNSQLSGYNANQAQNAQIGSAAMSTLGSIASTPAVSSAISSALTALMSY